jgi:hypothetical protein
VVKSNVADSHMAQAWLTLVVRAINSNTETWNIKYIAQFFALSFLNHYSIKDRFVDSPINVANTILNLSNLQINQWYKIPKVQWIEILPNEKQFLFLFLFVSFCFNNIILYCLTRLLTNTLDVQVRKNNLRFPVLQYISYPWLIRD